MVLCQKLLILAIEINLTMEDNSQNINETPFFSRGCCGIPNQNNQDEVFRPSCAKLSVYDWLQDIELAPGSSEPVFAEVRFKNDRKDFFVVPPEIIIDKGDIVAVESSPGHDIGIVSMKGETVKLQMKKKNFRLPPVQMKKVYRRARHTDIEKWVTAVEHETESIFKSRTIAYDLGLEMKINDVEFQGDGTKAIFYYTAEDRVDFRELIKVLAETFRVRIEMKQIGARQEAGRLGGLGSCGRELCCSTWHTNFTSVSTNTARTQQLSLNPSKLAGQCGKLKCCLNFENDMYLDAMKDFPSKNLVLKTKEGDAVYQKADVFKQIIWYSYKGNRSNMMAIPLDKVKKVIRMNEKGKYPNKLEDYADIHGQADYQDETENDVVRFNEEFI